MGIANRTFTLFLALTPKIGGKTLARIMMRNELLSRSPEQFFALSTEALREEYRLSVAAATSLELRRKERLAEALTLEQRLSGLGVTWVTSSDAHYPQLVEAMDPNPPGVLFLYGNTRLLESKTFCVMSSRNPMPADLDLIEGLCQEGILNGEVLVSGHNNPAYQRSAVVPLRWGSPRILCLDKGLFQVMGADLKQEAFSSARLWRYEFDPQTDLVVSPFRPNDSFIGTNNKVRDGLIGGLSRRLDFVAIQDGGNMQRIAKLAMRAGRNVRVSDRIIGYRAYLEQGATLLPNEPIPR